MSTESGVEIAKKTVISEIVKYALLFVGTLLLGVWAVLRQRLGWSDVPPLLIVAVFVSIWILYRREHRGRVEAPSAPLPGAPPVPRDPENAISIRLSQVRIVIEAIDSGVIYFTLLAFNAGSTVAETERLDVHGVMVGTYMLKTHDHSIPKSYMLPPHSPTELTFAFGLESVNVRLALIGITPAPNLRATPTATTRLSGTLVLTQSEKRSNVVVEQQIPPTQVSVVNSVVDALKKAGHLPD
jgi:hypothetical protein